MDKKKTKSQLPVAQRLKMFEKSEYSTIFADYVECKWSEEHVVMTFGLRNPDKPNEEAEILSRVYMTIPHYVRFSKMHMNNLKSLESIGIVERKE